MTKTETDSKRKSYQLRLALLKERSDYRAFWDEYRGEKMASVLQFKRSLNGTEIDYKHMVDFDIKFKSFGIRWHCPSSLELKLKSLKDAQELWLDALDPFNDTVPEQNPFQVEAAISQIIFSVPGEVAEPAEGKSSTQLNVGTPLYLKPSERLLRIDLSRKKSELISEFSNFLDSVDSHRNYYMGRDTTSINDDMKDIAENYAQWEQDISRYREECWRHLTVWKMRRQRKTFSTIAKELKINVDAAKKSFSRAFELIEGRKYEPTLFEKYKTVRKAELKKTCKDCPTRSSCTELCPDALSFADQGHVPQKHLITKTPLQY